MEEEKLAKISQDEVVTEDIESLRQALAEEKARAEKYLTNWQRAEADFANYKKRAEQEKNEVTNLANARLISNLLPVLDDLERAFTSLPPQLQMLSWIDGIKLIYRKLQAVLEAHGVTQIKTKGETFDPRFHEAVMQEEGEEGIILEELQKGYKLKERVLRPALVIVGKKGKKEGGEKNG